MTPIVNLHILAKRFTQLSRAAFFDPAFQEFASKTVGAIEHVIDTHQSYPDAVVREFEAHVWRVMQFVRGSRSNDAPYETQFVLRKALKEWVPEDALISSAALEEFNFFLNNADLWDFVKRSLNLFDAHEYQPLVVRIGAPEAYKHRPLFCVPLFHELGHFVDLHYRISEYSMLIEKPTAPAGVTERDWNFVNLNHRREFFADLFSACYCGSASSKSLLAIAPDNPDSPTHPSSVKRAKIIDDFVTGQDNPTVNLIQSALKARGKQELSACFSAPSITDSFNDVVTYPIANKSELYGVYLAGWDYLQVQLADRSAPWINEEIDKYTIEKTINDLVEKSIRNFEIRERWEHVVAN